MMTSTLGRRVLLSAMILAVIAGACTASQSDTTMSSGGESVAPATTAVPAAAEEVPDDAPAFRAAVALGTGAVDVARFQNYGRDIIFTAGITVAVTDVAEATEAATRQIAALGGFVFGQRSTGGPQPTSVLTFKVLPEDFQEALRRLGDLGELRTQDIATDDVTERIVDLESRINTAEASVERLRRLLEDAGDITTIAQLENQLLERETQLETLRGQLRTVEDQVALATINLTLTEALSSPAVAVAMSAYPGGGDSGQACPGEYGSLAVDEGDTATVCFEITNIGDTPLVDVELTDRVLGLELADMVIVVGDLDEPMLPGDALLVAAEVEPERDLRPQPRVTAVPLDADGEPLPGGAVSDVDSFFLDAVDPGGVPSFGEGLAASLDFLMRVGQVGVLLVGVALPFLWLPPLLLALWHMAQRRRRRSEHGGEVAAAG